MNNKGFAVSGIIYGILVLFIILLITLLSMFNSRKTVLDNLKEKVLNQVGSNVEIKEFTYTELNKIGEYKTELKGYYNIQMNNINGSSLSTNIYLNQGEKLYFKIANNMVSIYSDKEAKELLASINNSTYTIEKKYNDKLFLNTKYIQNSTKENKIIIKYIKTTRKNKNMNQVRYIKSCIDGSNKGISNSWTEIMAIVKGENVALNKDTKYLDYNNNIKEPINPKTLVDESMVSYLESAIIGEDKTHCAVIDLGRTYNLDYLYSYHDVMNTDKIYYGYDLSVSSANIEYRTIYNYEDNNVMVSAFENPKTKVVGNVYVPIKEFDGARWLRLYHFNNLSGTEYWDAMSQSKTEYGYEKTHRKSVLYNLNAYLNEGKTEFLLEYPEYDKNKYIRWSQTSDFTSQTSVSGFKLITNKFGTTNFKGLIKSDSTNSLISTTGNKYYEIGSIAGNRSGGIYGFNDTLITNTVDLWIKIDR